MNIEYLLFKIRPSRVDSSRNKSVVYLLRLEVSTSVGVSFLELIEMNYSDKLKDPRWQKKRLEILQRDNFTCRSCGRDDEQLHVHHMVYDADKLPWDYDNDDLVTLCNDCHKAWHQIYDNINPDTVDLIVKLFNKIESEQINLSLKDNSNKNHKINVF